MLLCCAVLCYMHARGRSRAVVLGLSKPYLSTHLSIPTITMYAHVCVHVCIYTYTYTYTYIYPCHYPCIHPFVSIRICLPTYLPVPTTSSYNARGEGSPTGEQGKRGGVKKKRKRKRKRKEEIMGRVRKEEGEKGKGGAFIRQ